MIGSTNDKNLNSEIETDLYAEYGELNWWPTNDKNLNSEIETKRQQWFSSSLILLPMIRISILRLKPALPPDKPEILIHYQ